MPGRKWYWDHETNIWHSYPPLCGAIPPYDPMPDYLLHSYPPESPRYTICPICMGSKSKALSDIALTFFNSISAIFDGLISVATGGVVKNFWSSLVAGEDMPTIIAESLHTAVIGLITDTEMLITGQLASFENQAAEHWNDFLGITELQTSIADSLQTEITTITDKWKAEDEAKASLEEESAETLAEQAGKLLGSDQEKALSHAQMYLSNLEDSTMWKGSQFLDSAIANFDYASLDIGEKLASLQRLGETATVDATLAPIELARVQIDSYTAGFRQTVEVPVAEAEAMGRMLSDVLSIDIEALPDELKKVIGLVMNSAVGFDYSEVIRKAGEATHGGE